MTSTVDRLAFIRALARDRALSPCALVVGIELLAHLNNGSGTAWPSPRRLALATGVRRRSVQRALAELVEAGWFAKAAISRGGPGCVTTYRPRWENGRQDSGVIELNSVRPVTVNSDGGVTVSRPNSDQIGAKTVTGLSPELLKRTQKEERSAIALPLAGKEYAFQGEVIRLTEPDFEKWKATYHTIADLKAELTRIDAALAEDGRDKKWFKAAAAMLNAKHQRLLEEQKPTQPAPARKLEVLQ